jgi:alpha-L-fucosidase 2
MAACDSRASRMRPNGTITLNRLGSGLNNFGHYTEQFAATMAVGELLIQSVDGIVRVFPAWPKEKSARFENLRAVGGFLVSAEQAGGEVREVQVFSTVGGRLRLLSPWPAAAVKHSDRMAPVPLKPDGRGIVEIKTKTGERLLFSAAR